MKRQIIEINETKCNGCGLCIPNCPEGALQIIDGKARLVGDLFCDGLGACMGECPEGAISTVEREAEPYNEELVMENIIKAGPNTIKAHLKHLKDHGETEYFEQAVVILLKSGLPIPKVDGDVCPSGSCPGTAAHTIQRNERPASNQNYEMKSELSQWPVQLHLLNPNAPYLDNAASALLNKVRTKGGMSFQSMPTTSFPQKPRLKIIEISLSLIQYIEANPVRSGLVEKPEGCHFHSDH